MAKSTFTPADKARAIQLINKGWKAKEVIDEIGCSPATLQNWKKDFKGGKISLSDLPLEEEEEYEEEDTEEVEQPIHRKPSHTPSKPAIHKESKQDFIKRYWRTQSVETVMDKPETVDAVIELINGALGYAYTQLSD